MVGTAINVHEGDSQAAFANIPLSMRWAAKVTWGGVTQDLPGTPAGEVVSVLARFVGLVLFGLLISIVGSSIRKVIFGSTELTQEKNQT